MSGGWTLEWPVIVALAALVACGACGSGAQSSSAASDASSSQGVGGDDSGTNPPGAADASMPADSATPNPPADGGPSGVADVDASGCLGVPIAADATGFVAPGTNSVGIHGSWFVYSYCADLGGKNCAMVKSPTGMGFTNVGGSMCTSGTTSTATGAWGAGIGLELNDGPPQMPFDTVAAGIKGFCFQLTGPTIPTTTVRVAFPTQDNNDNAYFKSVFTPGQHTVLFSDTAQGSWVTTPQPFEPTKVTLVQFQIPSSTTAPVAWDFCIEGLTAVMQ